VTVEDERRGALEALERILNRGGDADDVLRDCVRVLGRLYSYVAIDFVEGDELVTGPEAGERVVDGTRTAVAFEGTKVAELVTAGGELDDGAFLGRVATIVSPYCLVGWDTGGEAWNP
jgi:hypothetical protein